MLRPYISTNVRELLSGPIMVKGFLNRVGCVTV